MAVITCRKCGMTSRYSGDAPPREVAMDLRVNLAIGVLALLSAVTASAQVYRCPSKDGPVYQQAPCDKGAKLDVPRAPDPNSRDGRVQAAIAARKIVLGMTADEVVRSWGRPDKINSSVGSYGRHEQWVYRAGRSVGQEQYLYLQNGVVSSWQSSD